jgi:hypothetical protein
VPWEVERVHIPFQRSHINIVFSYIGPNIVCIKNKDGVHIHL